MKPHFILFFLIFFLIYLFLNEKPHFIKKKIIIRIQKQLGLMKERLFILPQSATRGQKI